MHESMIAACFGVPVRHATSGAPTLTTLADARLGELADAIASANWSTCSRKEKTLLRETATWLRVAATHVDLLRDIPRFLSVGLSRETYFALLPPAIEAGDALDLTLAQKYEDACIAANGNAQDAERYRWLRDNIQPDHDMPGGFWLSDTGGDSWDKTIDAAMDYLRQQGEA
ncbi:hypothetical protein [Achromobacter spanius]